MTADDPHEDWYFALLPPDWRDGMPEKAKRKYLAMLREPKHTELRLEIARRMRMRKLAAEGRFLAQQEENQDRDWWIGTALDEAMERISERVDPATLD